MKQLYRSMDRITANTFITRDTNSWYETRKEVWSITYGRSFYQRKYNESLINRDIGTQVSTFVNQSTLCRFLHNRPLKFIRYTFVTNTYRSIENSKIDEKLLMMADRCWCKLTAIREYIFSSSFIILAREFVWRCQSLKASQFLLFLFV